MRQQRETARVKGASSMLGVAVAALALCGASAAYAESAGAGTQVRNIASASFDIDGEKTAIASNAVATRVDELLDLTLVPKSGADLSVPTEPAPGFGIPFILTNNGNGTEAFHIIASVPGEAVSLSVAIDVDGNGAYDPAVDIDLSSDDLTPPVAPGGSLHILVRFNAAPTQPGMLNLSAQAATGQGAPGSLFTGKGDGGSDAIVGRSDASVQIEIPFLLALREAVAEPATLAKSQSVLAPDGSAAAMAGATITYRLELTTTGSEPLENAEIVDPVPAGTAYVPGSIRLNGVATSDARDSDAASFDGTQIRVALGDLNQPTSQIVTFQVIIQ